jgi:hypothetical protein
MAKVSIDKKALKKGFWGNTYNNWGKILAAFLALYLFESGFFTGLLFAAKDIRGEQYRSLGNQYFDDFERDVLTAPLPFPGVPAAAGEAFNRPDGCVAGEETVTVEGVDIQRPTGVQICDPKVNDERPWSVFPWVRDTGALGTFPACATAAGWVLTEETSPAFRGDAVAADPSAVACQNYFKLSVSR